MVGSVVKERVLAPNPCAQKGSSRLDASIVTLLPEVWLVGHPSYRDKAVSIVLLGWHVERTMLVFQYSAVTLMAYRSHARVRFSAHGDE